MSTLYILETGARLEKEYERLLVTKQDEVIFRVPIQRVSQVVVVGRAGLTTPAIHALLNHEIPTYFVNRSGRIKGRLLPPAQANLPRRQKQFERNSDEPFCFELTRQIVTGKIQNQRTYAMRLARRKSMASEQKHLDVLNQSLVKIGRCETLDSLRGVEGYAAKHFFALYRQAFDEKWRFVNRNRRPPRDPVNAVLSLGYSMLTQAMVTALEIVGLDPYLGFFHSEKYSRPALALDLVEEFRTPIVDSLTMTLFNRQELQEHDFQYGPKGAVEMSDHGLRLIFKRFSQKLESKILVRPLERNLSYRKLFEVQARNLSKMIEHDQLYVPFKAR